MNSKYAMLMAAAVVLAGTCTLRAETVLNGALGDEAKPAEVAPAPGPAAGEAAKPEKLTRPKMGDIVSPDAAKLIDDDELIDKLTGKKKGNDADPMVKLTQIMDRMGKSSDLLSKEKDTGLMTQEVQNRIVIDLDSMIEYLKKQEQKSQSQSQSQSQGQKKEESQTKSPGSQQQQGTEAAQQSQMPSGGIQSASSNNTDLHDDRYQWGMLPGKDRDLVTAGAKEAYLPEYSDMIKRYYEALAELGKTSKDLK